MHIYWMCQYVYTKIYILLRSGHAHTNRDLHIFLSVSKIHWNSPQSVVLLARVMPILFNLINYVVMTLTKRGLHNPVLCNNLNMKAAI